MQEKRLMLSGNYAVAYAVKQLDVDVVSAYPITPSTTVVEKIAEYVATGELKAKFVTVESEHSAMTVAIAASATGARSFTATSSQGLLLMHELLFMASGMRLPVVMAVSNRAISVPINIWNDHSDIMAQRDCGWIQVFAESNQEVYDRMVQAYRLAEHQGVRLPVVVSYDGVVLSHSYEPIVPLANEEVQGFSPKQPSSFKLDPALPVTFGSCVSPENYFEARYQHLRALEESQMVFEEVNADFGSMFGRHLGFCSDFMLDDADCVLVAAGSVCGTMREAAKRLRKNGVKVGVLGIKLYRPFPGSVLLKALEGVKAVGVVEKAVSPGSAGPPILSDIATLFYMAGVSKPLRGFIVGLGGRDITVPDCMGMFREMQDALTSGDRFGGIRYVGLRGGE